MPGSSRICTAVASPRSCQSCSTQTTFLSGRDFDELRAFAARRRASRRWCCRWPAACSFAAPGRTDKPPADRSCLNSQTVSPLGLTSRVRLSCSSVINVLPFLSRRAAHGELDRVAPDFVKIFVELHDLAFAQDRKRDTFPARCNARAAELPVNVFVIRTAGRRAVRDSPRPRRS